MLLGFWIAHYCHNTRLVFWQSCAPSHCGTGSALLVPWSQGRFSAHVWKILGQASTSKWGVSSASCLWLWLEALCSFSLCGGPWGLLEKHESVFQAVQRAKCWGLFWSSFSAELFKSGLPMPWRCSQEHSSLLPDLVIILSPQYPISISFCFLGRLCNCVVEMLVYHKDLFPTASDKKVLLCSQCNAAKVHLGLQLFMVVQRDKSDRRNLNKSVDTSCYVLEYSWICLSCCYLIRSQDCFLDLRLWRESKHFRNQLIGNNTTFLVEVFLLL